jgi:hypothetical protein
VALSSDELDQIRNIVRSELENASKGQSLLFKAGKITFAVIAIFFVVVIAHVLVIGGVTAYYMFAGSTP